MVLQCCLAYEKVIYITSVNDKYNFDRSSSDRLNKMEIPAAITLSITTTGILNRFVSDSENYFL